LSSKRVSFWRSPLAISLVLSFSSELSLFTCTVKVYIMGVLSADFLLLHFIKCESYTVYNVFNSHLTYFNHSFFTYPSGSFKMSLMVFGAGSHKWASEVKGIVIGCTSAAPLLHTFLPTNNPCSHYYIWLVLKPRWHVLDLAYICKSIIAHCY
jgi:uncharacterized CHY-type Zn-finger protein